MKLFKELLLLGLIGVLSVGTWLPLIHSGFFPMHDNTQVARVYELGKTLSDGMFPVRWVSDLGYGYGYPIFTFYAPLAYYVGGFLSFFTLPLIATKLMMGIGIVLSGLFMFLLARKLFGLWGGQLSAVLYLYAPYHAVDIYVRGDVAEFFAYAFIPLAFLGVVYLLKKEQWKGVLVGGLGFAGIIVSHNLTAMMVTPFLLVSLLVVVIFNRKLWKYALSLLFLGLGLSAFYFLPVFFEMHATNVLSQVGGGADFHDHFVCLSQLWQSQWGYGGSTKGCIDGLSFMIGKIQVIFAILGMLAIPFIWKKDSKLGGVLLGSGIAFLIADFLMLGQSVVIWNLLRPMAFFQYPWRFLLLSSFFSAMLGGGVIYVLTIYVKKQIVIPVVIILFLGIAVFSTKYFVPELYIHASSASYTNHQTLTFTTSKVSDEYMPKNFKKPTNFKEVPQSIVFLSKGEVHTLLSKTQEKKLAVYLPQPERIHINIAYFPAWTAYVNGKKTNLTPDNTGMSMEVGKGSWEIHLVYEETPIERLADIISLTSVAFIILVIIKKLYGSKSI